MSYVRVELIGSELILPLFQIINGFYKSSWICFFVLFIFLFIFLQDIFLKTINLTRWRPIHGIYVLSRHTIDKNYEE